MTDRFQGDPRLILKKHGSTLLFRGGQPEMDQGIENAAMISVGTQKGWCGNTLFAKPSQKIGSDYEKINQKAITVTNINEARMAAEKAMEWMKTAGIVDTVEVRITNVSYNRKNVYILLSPPVAVLELSYNGVNWRLQKINPAHLRI